MLLGLRAEKESEGGRSFGGGLIFKRVWKLLLHVCRVKRRSLFGCRVQSLFLSDAGSPPRVNFHNMLGIDSLQVTAATTKYS